MTSTPAENSPLADQSTTIASLKEIMRQFVDERDWQQFHSPKNLAMSLSIEAAEIMEHFQWLTIDESRNIDPQKKFDVAEEMSDVLCYLIAMANEMGIDLSDAFQKKMKKNRLKYPPQEFRGRFGKDDPTPVSNSQS